MASGSQPWLVSALLVLCPSKCAVKTSVGPSRFRFCDFLARLNQGNVPQKENPWESLRLGGSTKRLPTPSRSVFRWHMCGTLPPKTDIPLHKNSIHLRVPYRCYVGGRVQTGVGVALGFRLKPQEGVQLPQTFGCDKT